MSDTLAFGPWIKQRRRALDLTQDDLARRANCSAISIRKMEASDLTPSQSLARQLASALSVPDAEHEAFVGFARSAGASMPAAAFMRATADVQSAQRTTVRRYRMPARLTGLVGRERDVLVGCRLLRLPGVRLVTLTGPPGAGKTRLSLEIAEALQDEYSDGACFVPLAPLDDPELVKSTLAHALGVHEAAEARLPAALQTFLGDRNILLVFDNFEHLLAAAPFVTTLLTHAPAVKALASSREPLHVYGERELPVAPLSLPDTRRLPPFEQLQTYSAINLFVERAQAVKPDFGLDEDNAESVARLCELVDGLPLAIEMSAARIKWQAPQVLLAQLSEHLTLLASDSRDRARRQQTLWGAMDWSYDLLPEPERALLRRLSVFAGGFTVHAADAVFANGETVRDTQALLLNLADKSLLTRDDNFEERYALLETIRQYARDRLRAAGEEEGARERHARYWMKMAEETEPKLRGTEQVTSLQRLTAEQDNLRAALHWSLEPAAGDGRVEVGLRLLAALWFYWYARGYQSEVSEHLHVLLACPGVTARARVRGLSQLGFIEYMSGRFATARQFLADALSMSVVAEDDADRAWTLLWLGNCAVELGDPVEARSLFEQSLTLWRRLSDNWNIAYTLMFMGQLALQQHDDEQAQTLYEESAGLLRTLSDTSNLALPVRRLAQLALRRGDDAEAADGFAESLSLNVSVDDRRGIAACLEGLARVAAARGRSMDAARLDGYAQLLLDEAQSTLLGPDLQMRAELVEALSARLDVDSISQARAEGRALTLDGALALAAAFQPVPT